MRNARNYTEANYNLFHKSSSKMRLRRLTALMNERAMANASERSQRHSNKDIRRRRLWVLGRGKKENGKKYPLLARSGPPSRSDEHNNDNRSEGKLYVYLGASFLSWVSCLVSVWAEDARSRLLFSSFPLFPERERNFLSEFQHFSSRKRQTVKGNVAFYRPFRQLGFADRTKWRPTSPPNSSLKVLADAGIV